MRKNTLKNKLLAGKTVYCGWLHIANTWTAEIMGNSGWDGLSIDMQHGLHSIETAIQMMQAISSTETIPIFRSNWNEPGHIMRLLDGGAYGVICPMINNKAECEKFVGATKYPPLGYRSLGPTRIIDYAGEDYAANANDELLTLAMIETLEAVENIEGILSVASLDGIFIGSGDLMLSLEAAGKGMLFSQCINRIIASCETHGKIPGIWCNSHDMAKEMRSKGFRFIAVLSDSMLLRAHTQQLVRTLRNNS